MFSLHSLIISVVAVSGVTVFLSIIMVIADLTIGNYGEVKIKINDNKELDVEGGKSLLSTLMQEGIFIPSACGGRGSCGFCKVKVKSDIGEYLPTELPWIDEKEKNQNIRLACQIKVKKDISIEIPEELFNIKEYQTEVISLKDLTHDIKEVKLKLIEPDTIKFKAGQFIQFQVPEYELTYIPVYRAYSMSSAPSDNHIVELEIRYVPNGICTTYVHQHLKESDKIKINGPYGEFYLRGSDRDIIFIAGGSGMAPIKAILLDMVEKKINRKATYVFGARTKKDLFNLDLMEEIENKLPNFKFVPALSNPEPEDNWDGEVGLVTEIAKKYVKDPSNLEIYLCGSPGMVKACENMFIDLGVPANLIFYDKFA